MLLSQICGKKRLTLHHELAPGFTVPSRDFFATYQAYCRAEGRPVLPLGDLIVVVKAVFKDIETFRVGPPPVFTGFRLKNLAQSVNAPVSAPSVAGSPITAGSPLAASPMPSNGAQTPIPRAESTESLVSQKTEDNNPPSVSDQQNVPGMMDIDPLDSQSTVKKGDWACCWGHLSQGRVPECQESFASREDLFLHVRDAHLPESLSTYTCAWNGCFRISQSSRREQLVSHVGIHLLELSKGKKEMANGGYAPSPVAGVPPRSVSRPSATGLGLSSGTPQSHVFPDPNDELRGIPLTALLVLRNLARHPDNRSLYYPFEHELANLLAHHRYSKLVSSILVEL